MRDIQTYKEKISIKSEGTQRVFSKAWDNFSSYLNKQKSMYQVLQMYFTISENMFSPLIPHVSKHVRNTESILIP